MEEKDLERFEKGKEIHEKMGNIKHALCSYGILRFCVETSGDSGKDVSDWIDDLTNEECEALRNILISHYAKLDKEFKKL